MFLELQEIGKSFGDKPVLREVSLAVAAGEIVALLGPSGCGKTTLLRIIAGLETPDHGRVHLNNQDITNQPTHRRGFGFVFQDYALFPHKNVAQNVAFGLRMQNLLQPAIQERVAQVLALVGLAGFGERPIHELSGGEQQRVALARSLAPAPRLLLLDEPLGALDRALREQLMLELRRILKSAGEMLGQPQGMTAVYVTHDQAEAFAIADRVAVMNAGRLEQIGPPQELYGRPTTPFVARFLGMENILSGTAIAPDRVQTAIGELAVAGVTPGETVTLLIRPEAARLVDEADTAVNSITATLQEVSFRGRYQIITVTVADVVLKFEVDTAVILPSSGSQLKMALFPENILHLLSSCLPEFSVN
ncbi:MAG: ABC transporter ATP-binding protein [Chloroflexi bacterium]|nr:ABC transporter ATP-binding protein [Ardenticatenaceae bacterium]MBL1131347.1 ABC transporter ATP-binding protein [Chloroflexota bacterium]NOG37449.1 ABC transporter ATP-binding protein [Chloroflexota bacterium]